MKKRSYKSYIGTFVLVLVFILILEIVSHANGTYFINSQLIEEGSFAKEFSIFLYKGKTFVLGNYLLDLGAVIAIPLLFTVVFITIDFLSNKLVSKKKKARIEEQVKYEEFVDYIGSNLNRTHLFNVEDYRHFRNNDKVQDCLKRLYIIYREGETENVNTYFLILRKFDKGTKEREAMEYLVTFTEKKRQEELKKESKNEEK